MPTITLRKAQKVYPGTTIKAVSALDLEIDAGEFMCLLGPSGCGKTTTLRMIAGLETLSGGELQIGDRMMDCVAQSIFIPPEKRDLGLVFQSYALWPHLTVERNTDFGLRLRKVPKADREARVTEVMTALGIEAFRDRYPSQLSGGQQQRVALARMLAISPDVLLLDEPLSNLDARLRLEMRTELKRIHDTFGTTIVFVTHDQWEAMTLATTIAVMCDGTLQQMGTPDEIYGRPANRFVAEFVGSPPINILELAQDSPAVKVAQAWMGQVLPDIKAGSVGVRPETIVFDAVGALGDLTIPGRITGVLPTGGSWIIEVETGGQVLFATTHIAPQLRVGTDTIMRVAASAVHVFDPAGQRINQADDALQRFAA